MGAHYHPHLAEEFVDYFLNKIEKIREQFTGIQPHQPRQLDTTPLSKFASITTSQLRKTINSMPSKMSPLDTLQMDRLKQVLEGCLPAITHIINKSLDSSEFCSAWKETLVKTLVKKISAGTDKTNYRPVSNLGFISKIVKKVNLEQFTEHCNRNSLLPEYQTAYRKNHNCQTSLISLVNEKLWGMEEQLITAVVILDLNAAFNTMDHDLLLEVVEKWFGITGSARLWYQNYLKPRKFKVAIGQKK